MERGRDWFLKTNGRKPKDLLGVYLPYQLRFVHSRGSMERGRDW